MSLDRLGAMGGIGETLALLGIALLWTYRAQGFEWLRLFLEIWRGRISARDLRVTDTAYSRTMPRRPRHALVLAGALTLVVVGQILLILDLTF